MARLGIDFGTTNTVAAAHDRGMFCAVNHQIASASGTFVQELFPSTILIDSRDGQRWYGPEAERRLAQAGAASGFTFIGSIKRRLRDYAEGRTTGTDANDLPCDVAELLTGFLRSLNESIRRSLTVAPDEPLETVITWPANANGAQRYITRRCFRDAGFDVIDTLHEPTASAIELADCLTAGRKNALPEKANVAVFDFGGGTFDASVVGIDGTDFSVLASAGVEHLGGDDLDEVLLAMFLEKLRIQPADLGATGRYALIRQVRAQKETISTGAVRSLVLDPADFGLTGRPVSIPVEAYGERIRPMLASAVRKLDEVIRTAARAHGSMTDGPSLMIYLVGGSSKLPLVAEMVSAAFPKSRVVLTDKPFRSVAMGAAICAMDRVRFRDVFARHFGLIRLRDHGRMETFDTIFPMGTPIPRRGEPPLERATWYHPRHNIGHLRYLECASVGSDSMPDEGIRVWSDILFPYDPAVPLSAAVSNDAITATDAFSANAVCEIYRCDSDGVITVELRRPACGDIRCFEVFRD